MSKAVVLRLGSVHSGGDVFVVVDRAGETFALDALLGTASPDIITILADWDRWGSIIAAALARSGAPALDVGALTFVSPVPRPPKLICIGTNYHDHLREMHVTTTPEFPYAFLRPALSLAGHDQAIPLPEWPAFIDWEAELGIVIAHTGRHLNGADAEAAIGGYTVINDLSARDWIENRPSVGIDWVMQKGWDAFQPTGPWVTPAAFVANPSDLAIELTVNGVVRQSSNTAQMIFSPREIVEHLSRIMTLEAGDIIATGTPAGVGFGQKPRICLRAGDRMEVTIAQLGTLANEIVSPSPP